MMQTEFESQTHRRFNPLSNEWVLVSPHRTQRPWQGQTEDSKSPESLRYDPTCYLCPKNTRKGGAVNQDYKDVFVFTNDFSAILESTPSETQFKHSLIQAKTERGICRVICFSPRHDLTIPELHLDDVVKVVNSWVAEYSELGSRDFINHVQIFENKGSVMGCSNPHPHGQIWAQESIPVEPMKKQLSQKKHWEVNRSSLLLDYLKEELVLKERVLFENSSFVTLVPYWAVWPFETMILPKRQITNLAELNESEKTDFAESYQKMATLYDNLFEISFPYSAGIHQAPTDGLKHPYWQMHMVFYPPLLRSASVKKFMVGYEMLAEPQRDITPEASARILKALSHRHYKLKTSN